MINLRSPYYNNFENSVLMLLENGATIDELKTHIEIIVEVAEVDKLRESER